MSKYVVNLSWQDAPHLTEDQKRELLASYSPHERDARSKGLPQLGAGAIYPVVEADLVVEPFRIPESWPRCYAVSADWERTAALWGAYDEKSDCWYMYSEYLKGQAEPSIHADAIKARGTWMTGLMSYHHKSRSQARGEKLVYVYSELGLQIIQAEDGPNAIEPGILKVYQMLSSSRIRIFGHLLHTLGEFRIYRRDKNGQIVDKNTNLMDCMRFIALQGTDIMEFIPTEDDDNKSLYKYVQGRSRTTGY